jgi:hypothetical protein
LELHHSINWFSNATPNLNRFAQVRHQNKLPNF